MISIWFTCLSLLAQGAPIASQDQAHLKVVVRGLRNKHGKLLVNLFNQKKGFPMDAQKAHASAIQAINGETVDVLFQNLRPGVYAVGALHDENGNWKLDTHFMGPPKEGTGASNDAQGTWGPPSFERAAFRIHPGENTHEIKMRYR